MKKVVIAVLFILQATAFSKQYDDISLSLGVEAVLGAKITAQEVLLRFYHLKRLERGVRYLKKCIDKNEVQFFSDYEEQEKCLVVKGIHFTHNNIILTIKQMTAKRSFKPLVNIWAKLVSYKHIHDHDIIKEFAALIIYILHTNSLDYLSESLKNNLKAHQELTSLPLEDVLDILDILIDELPDFFDRYELDSEMSWYSWRKKYGIVATIAAVALGIKVYLTYQEHIDDRNEAILNGFPLLSPSIKQ